MTGLEHPERFGGGELAADPEVPAEAALERTFDPVEAHGVDVNGQQQRSSLGAYLISRLATHGQSVGLMLHEGPLLGPSVGVPCRLPSDAQGQQCAAARYPLELSIRTRDRVIDIEDVTRGEI
jgi:hypothetical protein